MIHMVSHKTCEPHRKELKDGQMGLLHARPANFVLIVDFLMQKSFQAPRISWKKTGNIYSNVSVV